MHALHARYVLTMRLRQERIRVWIKWRRSQKNFDVASGSKFLCWWVWGKNSKAGNGGPGSDRCLTTNFQPQHYRNSSNKINEVRSISKWSKFKGTDFNLQLSANCYAKRLVTRWAWYDLWWKVEKQGLDSLQVSQTHLDGSGRGEEAALNQFAPRGNGNSQILLSSRLGPLCYTYLIFSKLCSAFCLPNKKTFPPCIWSWAYAKPTGKKNSLIHQNVIPAIISSLFHDMHNSETNKFGHSFLFLLFC